MMPFEKLRLRQVETAIEPFVALRTLSSPDQGWVRTIRESLGMTLEHLAKRARVSRTAVRSAEVNEARGTIQMNSLRNLANAMDCEVVYALVPRASLEAFIKRQAERKANRLIDRVDDTMTLEDQRVSAAESRRQSSELRDQLIQTRPRDFWDEP
jgi:predicted DNA-binding mobile mystery protein A